MDKIKITAEEIIKAATECDTMMEAAASLNLAYTTFIRYAKKFDVYRPNQNKIGQKKGGKTYTTEDVLTIMANNSRYKTLSKKWKYGGSYTYVNTVTEMTQLYFYINA